MDWTRSSRLVRRLGRPRRLLAVLVLAGGLVALAASPASAHAEILSTSPSPGQVLTGAPSAITLSFNEPVSVSLGGVRVYNTREERVDAGGVDQTGNTVRLPLPKLGLGSYVVTWRVTSADSHPVEGAFTFQIGTAGNATSPAVTGLAQRLLATTKGEQSVGIAYGVIRGLVFAALALLIGGVAFAVVVFDKARASRRMRRLVWGAWWALVGATVVGVLVYGPYAAGLGLGDAFKGSVISDTLSNRFGEVSLVRLGLLLLAVPVLLVLFRRETTTHLVRFLVGGSPRLCRSACSWLRRRGLPATRRPETGKWSRSSRTRCTFRRWRCGSGDWSRWRSCSCLGGAWRT